MIGIAGISAKYVLTSFLHISGNGSRLSSFSKSNVYLWYTGFKSLRNKGKHRFPLYRFRPFHPIRHAS